jgi:hypothetical protein
MSQTGQTRKYSWPVPTSALSLKADVHAEVWNDRLVPEADMCIATFSHSKLSNNQTISEPRQTSRQES